VVRDSNSPATTPTPEGLIARREVDAWVLCLLAVEPTPVFRRLDWRFRGALSSALRAGGLSREPGAVSLLPCTREVPEAGAQTYRFLSIGVRERGSVGASELSALMKNVSSLGLKRIGLSASDFGWTKDQAAKLFAGLKGVETCVTE
jgi:hypothetical protein